jgi:hypothetical protein
MGIGCFDGGAARAQHVDGHERLRIGVVEQPSGVFLAVQNRFGHAVVDGGAQGGFIRYLAATVYQMPRSMRLTLSRPQLWATSVALDDHGEMVPMRGTTKQRWPLSVCFGARSVVQQSVEHMPLVARERFGDLREVDEFGRRVANRWILPLNLPQTFGQPRRGE